MPTNEILSSNAIEYIIVDNDIDKQVQCNI